MGTDAVRFLVVWMASWVNSRQLEVIDFLREENRVLREQLGGRRLRFNDDQRRRLAVKGRIGCRRRLGEFVRRGAELPLCLFTRKDRRGFILQPGDAT